MRVTRKLLAAGTAVAVIGLASAYAFAQRGPGLGHGQMEMGPGMMKGMDPGMMGRGKGPMMGNQGDPSARLAAIKTELGIKPEQTAAWDAYAKVVNDTAAEQREHRTHIDPDAVRSMTPAARQQRSAAMQQQRHAVLTKVNTAAETLLATLDEVQKTKARAILPGLAADGHGGGMRHGMMDGPVFGKRH